MRESQSLPYINRELAELSDSSDYEDSMLPLIGTKDDQDSQATEIYDYDEQIPQRRLKIDLDSESDTTNSPENIPVINPGPV